MSNISNFHIEDRILFALAEDKKITEKEQFHRLKNEILAEYKIPTGPSHISLLNRFSELVKSGKIEDELRIRKVLRKRAVRSLSGVSVISLLTKFWGCPGKCIYCPTYDGLPKSYISDEPAVQRAEMNAFDPFLQVQNRLRSLEITGNAISKCDVRIIGGTWSVYPQKYQEDFVKNIYDAHTLFAQKEHHFSENGKYSPFEEKTTKNENIELSETLEEAKKRNETAESRVIGMAIETRPDWITIEEIKRLRRYGITRVEIGYQTTHDDINEKNLRGHGNAESILATKLLKDAGFKVVAHMMPGLVGATPELDKSAMKRIFEDQNFRPDELKIYPMVVTPNSELTKLWEEGKFHPYEDKELIPLMAELQSYLPEYVRLNRMYRDIPAHEILAGSKTANLRQVTEVAMRARGLKRHDISAREIRAKGNSPDDAILEIDFYEASGGHEYFLQMIDPRDRTIFGLLRLRVPSQYFSHEKHFIPELENAALIREIHVFGDQIPVGFTGDHSGQHQGFGKKMIAEAERIIHEKYPSIEKMAVISGVGVRGYYEKRGYALDGEYMVKRFVHE
ncbi:tRNA uridine(34) 5-carboxymethylaminomethyl modification radical SAM/GNAT enzyme Elp3 [Candidatus Gracilibacteria bacterium]|nr:tRNA uridine(34) 5-carboxymethylaminomethyl modification radical SAM/GNAT enzyme Elp3 [Candidatus Gracilibacteria bacterium]